MAAGINAGDVKKLQEAGIYTCNGLMMQTKKTLANVKGLSEAKVEKIMEAASKLVVRESGRRVLFASAWAPYPSQASFRLSTL